MTLKRKPTISFLRPITFLWACSLISLVSGQSTMGYQYLLALEQTDTKSAIHRTVQELTARLPGAKVIWHHGTGVAEVRVDTSLDLAAFNTLLIGTGHEATCMARYGAGSTEVEAIEGGDVEPFPVLWETGNEEQDHLRYATAKARWVQAYPVAYERMITGHGTK